MRSQLKEVGEHINNKINLRGNMNKNHKKPKKDESCTLQDALEQLEKSTTYSHIPKLSARSIEKDKEKESYYTSYDSEYDPNPEFYLNPETELDF